MPSDEILRKAYEAEAEDLIGQLIPVLEEPIAFRGQLRAGLEGVVSGKTLDAIYGADTGRDASQIA